MHWLNSIMLSSLDSDSIVKTELNVFEYAETTSLNTIKSFLWVNRGLVCRWYPCRDKWRLLKDSPTTRIAVFEESSKELIAWIFFGLLDLLASWYNSILSISEQTTLARWGTPFLTNLSFRQFSSIKREETNSTIPMIIDLRRWLLKESRYLKAHTARAR